MLVPDSERVYCAYLCAMTRPAWLKVALWLAALASVSCMNSAHRNYTMVPIWHDRRAAHPHNGIDGEVLGTWAGRESDKVQRRYAAPSASLEARQTAAMGDHGPDKYVCKLTSASTLYRSALGRPRNSLMCCSTQARPTFGSPECSAQRRKDVILPCRGTTRRRVVQAR